MKTLQEMERAIDSFAALPDGWNTYDAKAPNEASRRRANEVLRLFAASDRLPDSASADVNGGVGLTFTRDKSEYAYVFAQDDGTVHAALLKGRELEDPMAVLFGLPDELLVKGVILFVRTGDLAALLIPEAAIPPWGLSLAAERLGEGISDQGTIVPRLLALLGHADPTVREGAIEGLAYHSGAPRVQDAIAKHADESFEKSPGVWLAAKDLLEP